MTYRMRAALAAVAMLLSITLSACDDCEEGGNTYSEGDRWTCSDGCNQCGCSNGGVNQTAKACVDPDEVADAGN
jgi:hypothetical protein